MCRAVSTVPWTTKQSAPASCTNPAPLLACAGEPERAQLKAAVDFLGVDRHPARNEGDFIEAVGAAGSFEAAQLDGFAGLEGRGLYGRTHTHRRRLRNRVELKGYACTSIRGGFGGL